jgi:hypothetical protein
VFILNELEDKLIYHLVNDIPGRQSLKDDWMVKEETRVQAHF